MASPHTPHDSLFRALLDEPARAEEILRRHLPREITAQLADVQPIPVSGTFIDEELRNSQSDLLFEVRLKDGETAYVYILLEHKSTPDARTPLQLLRYMTRIWDRVADPDVRRLPVVIPMVVYHGTAPWTVPRSVVDALHPQVPFREQLRDLRYFLLDLNRTADEDLAQDPETRSGLLALKYAFRRDGMDRLTDILRGLRDGTLLEGQVVHYIAKVFRDLTPDRLRAAARQVAPELEAKMVSLVEYCREEGRMEGRQEGIATGKAFALLSVLRARFGPIAPELERRIEAAGSDELDTWLARAATADRPEDVFSPSGRAR